MIPSRLSASLVLALLSAGPTLACAEFHDSWNAPVWPEAAYPSPPSLPARLVDPAVQSAYLRAFELGLWRGDFASFARIIALTDAAAAEGASLCDHPDFDPAWQVHCD